MPSFAHKKISDAILANDKLPDDAEALKEWVGAQNHIQLLRQNVPPAEVVIYGSGTYTFIHSIVVPNKVLDASPKIELLSWSANPFTSYASYVSSNGHMAIEIGDGHRGCEALNSGRDLIFGRIFEGWSGVGRSYFELSQEYSHLCGIHWRPEHSAYCKYDSNGDLRHVVSISTRDDADVSLVTFTWEELEEYLAIANLSLVRMFDFTLLNHANFLGWSVEDESIIELEPELIFRQKREAIQGYTRGVQILRSRVSSKYAAQNISDGWLGQRGKEYVEFIAHDWRNKRISKISTDPAETANYFNADGNQRPFELSPAFFRPEVLSKYKTDRDKYTIGERSINCRSAWHLKGYDVNEAGQVHAYICDVRALPYTEQLHWLSFNEEPKAGLSERAIINDFMGEFVYFSHPRQEIISIARRWSERPVSWWRLRDRKLLDRANLPLTSSIDEWAAAFMDLSKLLVEGFQTGAIRDRLIDKGIAFDRQEQSISLLRRLLSSPNQGDAIDLAGLRTVQNIRSKVAGHSEGSEARQIANDAISQHGTYAAHFTHVCGLVAKELEAIAACFES